MTLGILENKILELVDNKIIDVDKVEDLFKKGANPNALWDEKVDRGWDGDEYWSTFFSECIFASQEKEPNLFPLLELFIKYGLDVNKYGPSIIGDFHFIRGNNDIYEMTKIMLDKMDRKTNIHEAISGIGVESSYLNCCFDNMDAESNDLLGLCIMLENFTKNKPYKSFYRLPKKINKYFKKIHVKGEFVTLEKNKIAVESKSKSYLITKIEMENHDLVVEENCDVYINDEDDEEFTENIFTQYANEYFKGEKIVDLKFKHYEVEVDPTTHAQGRVVTINFTNNKKLIYDEDIENRLETIEIK